MAKYFNQPIPVGHWNAEADPTFRIIDTTGNIILESKPATGSLHLVLPAKPTEGDWYEFSDPLGLVSSSQPMIITAADGRDVQGGASISANTPGVGGKLVFDAAINMWCLITTNPCPYVNHGGGGPNQ
jgi:hypothetical protein